MAVRTHGNSCAAAAALGMLALGGCGMGGGHPADERHPPDGELAGVYAGRFPCSNCEAIDATLWLRPDGAFFFRQRYVLEDGSEEAPAYARGRWRWDDGRGALVLDGPGPERRFEQLGPDRLRMQTASPVEHLLERDPAAPPFGDRLRLEGETTVLEGAISFRDCLTGLAYLATGGEGFTDLRWQHRRLNRANDPSVAELDGHVERVAGESGEREVLVVDRFVTLKPRIRCETQADRV